MSGSHRGNRVVQVNVVESERFTSPNLLSKIPVDSPSVDEGKG